MTPPRTLTLFTHGYPDETAEAVGRLMALAGSAGVEVRASHDEAAKHSTDAAAAMALSDTLEDSDLAVVFGGDGTILRALRTLAGRGVPVFAFNYGAIGFLSTVDHDTLEDGLAHVFSGGYDTLAMPALAIDIGGAVRHAVNDVSFHRRPSSRVAELAYSVGDEQLGRVRCDGLVASTPVGSTGYNLANGGPVLAWGVQGYVVSFIAPHTITARGLVVATSDVLKVTNVSERDAPVDVTTDGRTVGQLGRGEDLEVRFLDGQVLLAQLPGTTFYRRLREKFGRLAY